MATVNITRGEGEITVTINSQSPMKFGSEEEAQAYLNAYQPDADTKGFTPPDPVRAKAQKVTDDLAEKIRRK